MSSSLLDSLNPQQREAVTYPAKPALILAGAGTGKTRVLTTRIAYLLEQGLANVQDIFAVTFTNKASREMSQRIGNSISGASFTPRAMWMGTFHGLCNRFLRLHYEAAKLPPAFAILDQDDQFEVISNLMDDNKLYAVIYGKMSNLQSHYEVNASVVQQYINRQKEAGLRAKDVEIPKAVNLDYILAISNVYGIYEKKLESLGVVDFAELILRTYEVLREEKEIRQQYQNRFKHILVDEFQDTNKTEYELIKLFSAVDEPLQRTNAVFAVGDDDQAIYGFRGASIDNMWRYKEEFNISDSELIRLEHNYRSHGHILRAANTLIANNKERFGKNLWSDIGDGEKVETFRGPNPGIEAELIASLIGTLIKSGEKLKEIAVLYRTNAQSWAVESALDRVKIRCTVYGGQRFYEREEIKNCLAYLRLAENPHNDFAFLRAVNAPPVRITESQTKRLERIAMENRCSLFTAAQKEIEEHEGTKLGTFVDIIEDLREKKDGLHLSQLVSYTIEHSGLKQFYENKAQQFENNENVVSDELENLNEIVNAAAAFVKQEQIQDDIEGNNFDNLTPLAQFLAQATLESGENQANADKEAVQLMSIHAAKGLEFNNVFISGAEQGLIPHYYSCDEKGISGERRLMYVAITRAKNKLFMSWSQKRYVGNRIRSRLPSRFIYEISPVSIRDLGLKDIENYEYPRKENPDSPSSTETDEDGISNSLE